MRAMELIQPGPPRLALVERPSPMPGPGEVCIDVAACAVCRTDLQLATGDITAHRSPLVPGHQVVGRISAIGAGVDPVAHAVGSRVGAAWIGSTCGRCRFCSTGRENLCESAQFTGWDRDGGFADQMVARADFVYRLPDEIPGLQLAPLLCGGAIGFRSLRIAEVDLADAAGVRLGLYGFGASATCVIQLAVHAGCEVYVVTRSTEEQERARRLGAVWAGSYDDVPPAPLDAAITFAPAGAVVVQALEAVDRGGIVAINAIHLDGIPAFGYESLWLERSLRSVANVTRTDVTDFFAAAAAVPVETQIEVFDLVDANRALDSLAAGHIAGAAVLRVSESGG